MDMGVCVDQRYRLAQDLSGYPSRQQSMSQSELLGSARVNLLLRRLRHHYQRYAVIERLHDRARPSVGEEDARVAQHGRLREMGADFEVHREPPQLFTVDFLSDG